MEDLERKDLEEKAGHMLLLKKGHFSFSEALTAFREYAQTRASTEDLRNILLDALDYRLNEGTLKFYGGKYYSFLKESIIEDTNEQ